MEDRSATSNNHKPPQEFAEYLHTLLTEVLINGEKLNRFTKWLKKYCDEYGVEFETVKTEVDDFIELMDEYSKSSSNAVKKSLSKTGNNLFLSTKQINTLIYEYKDTVVIPTEVISTIDEERKSDWEDAKIIDEIAGYQDFIDKYEKGKFIPTAKKKLKALEHEETEDVHYDAHKNTDNEDVYYADNKKIEWDYKEIFGWLFFIGLVIVIIISENGGCN